MMMSPGGPLCSLALILKTLWTAFALSGVGLLWFDGILLLWFLPGLPSALGPEYFPLGAQAVFIDQAHG